MFMAACKAPQIPEPPHPRFLLPDAQFKEALRQLGGTPDEVLDNTELMDIYLPAVRADFALKEGYVHRPCAPFHCPITVFCGDRDNEAPPADVTPWQLLTHGRFYMRTFEGGHFFLHDHFPAFLGAISQSLGCENGLPFSQSEQPSPLGGYTYAS